MGCCQCPTPPLVSCPSPYRGGALSASLGPGSSGRLSCVQPVHPLASGPLTSVHGNYTRTAASSLLAQISELLTAFERCPDGVVARGFSLWSPGGVVVRSKSGKGLLSLAPPIPSGGTTSSLDPAPAGLGQTWVSPLCDGLRGLLLTPNLIHLQRGAGWRLTPLTLPAKVRHPCQAQHCMSSVPLISVLPFPSPS